MPTLHWLNDEEARKTSSQLPYRLLEADTKLSYGDTETENMLIQGDNLEALKALLPYYAGQVKCIFIDPPYNTRSAFEHYDDNLEHSIWLSTMYPRLELLRELLAKEGSIWVTIDENEGHYLKVLMDEVFGRNTFISTIVWENFYGRSNAAAISPAHNYILCYSPIGDDWKHIRRLLPRTEKSKEKYSNPDNDVRGSWRLGPIFAAEERHEGLMYTITTPSGRKVSPPKGSHWRMVEEEFWRLVKDNRISFGKDGKNIPALKLYLNEVQDGLVPRSWWSHTEAGHTQDGKREIMALFPDETPFGTPKPEKLLRNIIEIASKPGEMVLDSFLGSGTTAAVAHKMGRKYIGIEMGDHAITFCAPRLKKVIEGEQGGISEDVNWQGGGGFRFYQLGETIFDEQGHINSKVKFKSLAAHVWFSETHTPLLKIPKTPLLGVQNEIAFYLLYNGILGDKTPAGGNVLTARVLRELPKHKGGKVIYGEMCMLDEATLQKQEITFKHIPYDIKAR
jgi:adenine-specific DNA-methyltransferase